MKFNNGDEVSFFKILLSNTVDYLPLPSAFTKTFLEQGIAKKQTLLVLKPKSAIKWRVKCVKIEHKYYFIDGWLKFIKDNSLKVGDFLVFWLLSVSSKSTFQVFFYEPNGSLKHPIPSSGDEKKLCVKEETGNDDVSNDGSLVKVPKSFQCAFKKSRLRQMPMNKRFWEAAGMGGYGGVRLRNDEGKTWEVKVSEYGRGRLPHLTTGWSDFWKSNKMTAGNTCEISHVGGDLLHVRVIKKTRGKPMRK